MALVNINLILKSQNVIISKLAPFGSILQLSASLTLSGNCR